eukprot:3222563-Pleurochrysis_carterae.AAC.1
MPHASRYVVPMTHHRDFITDCRVCACLSVFPICSLLFNFIPDHDAFAGPRRDARKHATARRPQPAAAPRARPTSEHACSPASQLTSIQ